MNDMSGRFHTDAPIAYRGPDLALRNARLEAPRAFTQAMDLIEDALVELRAVEHALERQLSDVRACIGAAARLSS